MLSYKTGDIDYDAGKEDLKILFKESDEYHTTLVTNEPDWSIILLYIQAGSPKEMEIARCVPTHTSAYVDCLSQLARK
jgi:hypothetical protein